jgi:WD repeat-containing protein 92
VLGGDGKMSLYKYRYPKQRVLVDAEGREKGVVGSLELLNDKPVSKQPIVSLDWH